MSDGEAAQPALVNAFLLTTKDALMVFEAARRGICPVVTRRLHDTEKATIITSGSVFAFDETSTGIKRWTDGALWSPSRIIGNYLVYRELEKKKGAGGSTDKGKAREQAKDEDPLDDKQRTGSPSRPSSSSSSAPGLGSRPMPSPEQVLSDPFGGLPGSDIAGPSTTFPGQPKPESMDSGEGPPENQPTSTGSTGLQRDLERALVGSLTSSYRFKRNGLVKKTISNGNLHIVCYYTIEDVVAGRLRTPSSLTELTSLEISPSLLNPKHFRIPPMLEYDLFGMPHYIGEESDPVGIPASIGPLLAYSRPITPAAAQARRSSIAPASVPSTSHGGTYGPGTDLRASLGSRSYHSPSVAYSATFAHQAEFAQDHRRPSTSGPLGTEYDYVPPGSQESWQAGQRQFGYPAVAPIAIPHGGIPAYGQLSPTSTLEATSFPVSSPHHGSPHNVYSGQSLQKTMRASSITAYSHPAQVPYPSMDRPAYDSPTSATYRPPIDRPTTGGSIPPRSWSISQMPASPSPSSQPRFSHDSAMGYLSYPHSATGSVAVAHAQDHPHGPEDVYPRYPDGRPSVSIVHAPRITHPGTGPHNPVYSGPNFSSSAQTEALSRPRQGVVFERHYSVSVPPEGSNAYPSSPQQQQHHFDRSQADLYPGHPARSVDIAWHDPSQTPEHLALHSDPVVLHPHPHLAQQHGHYEPSPPPHLPYQQGRPPQQPDFLGQAPADDYDLRQ